MSNAHQKPWSDNPNAPVILYGLYIYEKVSLAGNLVSSILYGILIMVFFRSMAALFNPDNRRGEPIKWGLVSYTVVMFSVVTLGTAMQLDVQSISYIDNREFPGAKGMSFPGPLGYQWFILPEAISIIQNILFVLNNWLADGFLLYRCYIIYSMNHRVLAFPCLMYLGSLATGIVFVYQYSFVNAAFWSSLSYFSISLSLNTLLTLMIVIRLVLHARNTRTALGITGIGGLSRAIIIMLVESCALYAVSSLSVIGPLGAENSASNLFLPILAQTQVIAPLLIIQRVANKSALTSNTVVSARISEFKARSRGELTGVSGNSPGEDTARSVDERGMDPSELGIGIRTTNVDFYQDET